MHAVKNPGSRFYRPELDVLRFVAFLLVFLSHALPTTRNPHIANLLKAAGPAFDAFGDAAGYGLSLFFTLSAFLICELLLRERKSVGTVEIKQFYIRRILRIWPLYYFALALGLVVVFLPGGHIADVTRIGWFAIFMGAWYTAMHGWTNNPIISLWSISVEEQFYLIAPWTLKYFSRKALYGFCGMIILVANGWLYYLGSMRATNVRVWADSFVQFECFAAGILLCLALHNRMPRVAFWRRLIMIAICCFCWMTSVFVLRNGFIHRSGNPGSLQLICAYALASLGCVLLLVAFLGVDAKLLPRWAVYLGRISFGLYVYHRFALYIASALPLECLETVKVPVRIFLKAGLLIGLPFGLTVLMATVSYRYFEMPFLKMKKRHSLIESQPIVGAG